MNDNVLIHFGKKGMKWGKHTSSQLSNVKSGTDSARSGTDAARSLNSIVSSRRSKKGIPNISKMSDKELQEKINRMGMEQRYSDLAASNAVKKGHVNIDTALAVTGSVLAIGSSAIGIAVAMKQLKGL